MQTPNPFKGKAAFQRRTWRRAAVGMAGALAACLAPVAQALAQDSGQGMTLIRDAEIEDILRQDSDPIFLAAGLNPGSIKIHLIGDKEINAFVAGGQQIFLNTGMIVETKNPDELQGVIAHETGHIAGGHLVRIDEGSKGAMKTFFLTLGLGVVAALAGAPGAGGAIAMSAGQFATLDFLAYSRTQEAQADQAAATYLDKAGISGRGLVDFFENFRAEEVFSNASRYPYFQSHPLSGQRIDALRSRVVTLPHYRSEDTAEAIARHQIMVAKLKAFVNYPAQTFQDYPETDTSFPARYARAIAYYKSSDTTRAMTTLESLLKDNPENPYLWELKGQIYYETGKPADAEGPQRKALALKPDASLLQVSLGQTLIATNDAAKVDEAVVLLRTVVRGEPDEPMAWRLLSQAYDFKGQDAMARLAAAEQNFAIGNVKQSRIFAMRARELLPRNSPEWRRATDIVLVSDPDKSDLDRLSRDSGSGLH